MVKVELLNGNEVVASKEVSTDSFAVIHNTEWMIVNTGEIEIKFDFLKENEKVLVNGVRLNVDGIYSQRVKLRTERVVDKNFTINFKKNGLVVETDNEFKPISNRVYVATDKHDWVFNSTMLLDSIDAIDFDKYKLVEFY